VSNEDRLASPFDNDLLNPVVSSKVNPGVFHQAARGSN
jgi:hypothetical protein